LVPYNEYNDAQKALVTNQFLRDTLLKTQAKIFKLGFVVPSGTPFPRLDDKAVYKAALVIENSVEPELIGRTNVIILTEEEQLRESLSPGDGELDPGVGEVNSVFPLPIIRALLPKSYHHRTRRVLCMVFSRRIVAKTALTPI